MLSVENVQMFTSSESLIFYRKTFHPSFRLDKIKMIKIQKKEKYFTLYTTCCAVIIPLFELTICEINKQFRFYLNIPYLCGTNYKSQSKVKN